MTQEEKAKAYDEALAKAAKIHRNYKGRVRAVDVVIEKVFPELKESEDEKVRKAIRGWIYTRPASFFDNGISKEEILAWFERQGEHLENFDEAEKEKSDFVGDGFIKCFANFLDFKEGNTYWLEYMGDDKYNVRSDNLLGKTYHITPCQLYTVFKKLTWLEKQGNQKPAFEMKTPEESLGIDSETYSKIVDECIYGDDDNKPAWNEEDENRINRLVAYFEDKESFTAEDDIVYANWLKSLKDRFIPQPKQEWSEKDKHMLQKVIDFMKHPDLIKATPTLAKDTIDWLKSLRPHNRWKPSDEHYELEEFAKIVRNNLTGISKAVQKLFEAKYLQLTGDKMFRVFKD